MTYEVRLKEYDIVCDLIQNRDLLWPEELQNKFPFLNFIPILNVTTQDVGLKVCPIVSNSILNIKYTKLKLL